MPAEDKLATALGEIRGPAAPSLLTMMANAPRGPEWSGALEAWIAADKARDKARQAFEQAEQAALEREAELRAVYLRLASKEPPGE